ncbi:MAG TPA: C25 family cysteine peptidase [Bacillota bacterium]|nr:C25 family cysteine peptidase [Bacillota bacterium]
MATLRQQKLQIILLSIDHWLGALAYSTAALARPGSEIFLLNPEHPEEELAALKLLRERLPIALVDATAHAAFGEALRGDPELAPLLENSPLPPVIDPDQIQERFGPLRGLVTASQDDPSRCLKAAVLAVRLGYHFIPEEILPQWPQRPEGLPLVQLGSDSDSDSRLHGCGSCRFIPNDAALAEFMRRLEPPPGYLLLYNSDDIYERPAASLSLGDYRVRGLSLLAPLIASYRPVFPYDAYTDRAEARAIEKELNGFVAGTGLQPEYLAILASPGTIPFIYDRRRDIGSRSEVAVRDIHLRLNDDLFFDLAEGRLFQSTPGGLSLQIISSKHYHRITGSGTAEERAKEVLVVTAPHVEGGIIFASDGPLIEGQLKPLLQEAGCRVHVLAGEEAHYACIAAALPQADFFLYTGHGGPESLHTHGRFLSRRELPPLPPLVAFASACSTVAVDAHWYSTTDGLDWNSIPVFAPAVIGLAMVERGAVCYVGGTTLEDLQYSTSLYSIFMEALLVKGCSVGEAVRRMRNFVSLYASLMQQKAPEGYACYKQGTAAAIHQQLLLGDPALVPCPRGEGGGADLPQEIEMEEGGEHCRLRVTIPEVRWRRSRSAVSPLPPSKYYYRSRAIEVLTPFGEDVVSWGDYYRVAPDAEGITEVAVMSSFLHLHLDLLPGRCPLKLKLLEAKAAGAECLLCGREMEPPANPTTAFQDFRLPYLLLPPTRMDMTSGWAFAVEERGPGRGLRVHWLVPVLAINEATRTAVRAAQFLFELETAPAQELSGRVVAPGGGEGSEADVAAGCLVSAALPAAGPGRAHGGTPLNVVFQVLTRPDGTFKFTCAGAATVLAVSDQFPLYELAAPCRTLRQERLPLPLPHPEIRLRPAAAGRLSGKVLDSMSAAPLPGALVRVWRGFQDPVGDPLIEGFAAEACSDAAGSFAFELPAGKYILSAVARHEERQYKSKTVHVEIFTGEEQHLLLPLDEAALVSGRVAYGAAPPPHPPIVSLMRYPEKEGGEVLVSTPVRPDGSFSCLVGFQDRFYVWIEEEGWQAIRDYNQGQGYKLGPGEEIFLHYTLLPEDT